MTILVFFLSQWIRKITFKFNVVKTPKREWIILKVNSYKFNFKTCIYISYSIQHIYIFANHNIKMKNIALFYLLLFKKTNCVYYVLVQNVKISQWKFIKSGQNQQQKKTLEHNPNKLYWKWVFKVQKVSNLDNLVFFEILYFEYGART